MRVKHALEFFNVRLEKRQMNSYQYDAVIHVDSESGGAYVAFPWDIRKEFGKGRVKVHAEFDQIPYDGSIVNMGVKNTDGSICYVIGILKSIRSKLGKGDGDTVHVVITVDTGDLTLNEALFFSEHVSVANLYQALKERIYEDISDVRVKVQKTQISFYTNHMFAAVSFTPVRKAKERPDSFLTVTFGLRRKVDSPRIDVAVEPYPDRWTHHVMICVPEEVDDELMEWIKEAAGVASNKR